VSLYWINREGRLGIMPRPRGNDWLSDDLRALRRAGMDVVVSALTAPEAEELGLVAEAEECPQNGLLFIAFPIEDRSVPAHAAEFARLGDQLVECSRTCKSVAIHCRAGIGRSSLVAACMLTKMGLSPDGAFRAIEQSRGCPVPDTPEQRQWVERYSDFSKLGTQCLSVE
jgi:protein-tyrosine phosphatase